MFNYYGAVVMRDWDKSLIKFVKECNAVADALENGKAPPPFTPFPEPFGFGAPEATEQK